MCVKFGFFPPSRHVECARFSKSPSDSSSPEIAWCFVETRMWWNMKTPEAWNQHELLDDLKSITQKMNPPLFSTCEYKIERFVSKKLRIKIDFTALCLLQSWAFWKKKTVSCFNQGRFTKRIDRAQTNYIPSFHWMGSSVDRYEPIFSDFVALTYEIQKSNPVYFGCNPNFWSNLFDRKKKQKNIAPPGCSRCAWVAPTMLMMDTITTIPSSQFQ